MRRFQFRPRRVLVPAELPRAGSRVGVRGQRVRRWHRHCQVSTSFSAKPADELTNRLHDFSISLGHFQQYAQGGIGGQARLCPGPQRSEACPLALLELPLLFLLLPPPTGGMVTQFGAGEPRLLRKERKRTREAYDLPDPAHGPQCQSFWRRRPPAGFFSSRLDLERARHLGSHLVGILRF